MKRYRLVESDVAAIDPDLKALYEAVEGLEANKPGSAEKFTKIIQTKYGITSTDSLKKKMSMWLRIPIGGLSIAGFVTSITGAIVTAEFSVLGLTFREIAPKEGGALALISMACVMASFVFWKILKYVSGSSNKTESINNSYSEQKAILESEIFINRMGQFIESDAGDAVVKFNATAEKADGICRRMFNWIKGKVSEGWGWIKKHPYITTAFLIVIGCVFYYINVLGGKIANLQGTVRGLQDTNAGLSKKVAELSKQLALNIDSDKFRQYLGSEREHVKAMLTHASEILDNDGSMTAASNISDDLTKSLSSMNKDQFTAYFKCISDIAHNRGSFGSTGYSNAVTCAHLALDRIFEIVGSETYEQLENVIQSVAFK